MNNPQYESNIMDYNIMYDNGKILCLVGVCAGSDLLQSNLSRVRACEKYSYEDLLDKDQAWFDQRQFLCPVVQMAMKKTIVEFLDTKNVNWFSAIGKSNQIAPDVKIGKGALLYGMSWYNHGNVVIGNHAHIIPMCTISHETTIGDYCFIGPFCYTSFCTIGAGVSISQRAMIQGSAESKVLIPDWCNIIMDSRINMSLPQSGTFQGHRMRSPETSLDIKKV